MVKKVFGVAALVVLALATTASTASAQDGGADYPPATNSITLSDTTVAVGDTVTGQAQTYADGATVAWEQQSTPIALGTVKANSAGVATLTFKVPAGTTPGTHHVVASGIGANGQLLTQSAAIVVSGGTSATVPKTGANSTKPMAEIGVGALALGGLLVLVSRRRSKAHAAA
jgi:LPXTG-motif cell wall-anchored protein